MRSQSAMAKAMKGVSKAMAQMNARMNLPQLQKIMMDFEREVSSDLVRWPIDNSYLPERGRDLSFIWCGVVRV